VGRAIASIDPLGKRTTTTYDVAGRAIASIDPLGNRTSTTFDAASHSIASINPLGLRTSTNYDSVGRAIASIDPLGKRTTTTYDVAGRAITAIDPLGNRTSTTFDAASRTIASINPLGLRTSTNYDSVGRAIASIDPLGKRTTTTYDVAGRAIASIDPLGNRTSTTFDAASRTIASINPLGLRTSTNYDSVGRAIASIDPLGKRATTSFDAAGRSIASIDPLGNRTSTTFDAASRAIASINPLSFRTSTNYDAVGRAIASIDALANRTSTTFDAAGRAIASIDPLGNRTSTTFDAAGRSIASINPLGLRTSTNYDPVGRAIASIDPLGKRTSTTLDASGRSIARIDPLGNRTSTTFDAASRTIATINPLGLRTSTNYDPVGRAIASVDPFGKRTTTTFDAAGRAIASIDPLGNRTSTTFDAAGRTVATINALGQRTSMGYDNAGRQINQTDARGNRSSTVYDAAGRTVGSIDPLGGRITNTFDAAGRQTRVQNALGFLTTSTYLVTGAVQATIDASGGRITNAYDAAGRQRRTQNALGFITTTTFDATGRSVATIDALLRRVSTTYDAVSRPIARIDGNGNRASTIYDVAGRSIATVNALGYRITSVYDAASQRTGLIDPNGRRVTFLFDAAGRDAGSIDPLLRRVTTGYDAAGNRLFKLDPRGIRVTSVYDQLNRPTTEQYSTGKRNTYGYDAVGNRTRLLDSTGLYTTTFDAKSRTTAVTNPNAKRVSYSYDLADNRTRLIDPDGGRFTNSFDAKNRQTRVLNPQGKRTSLGYDAADQLVQQIHGNGSRTTQMWDGAGQMIGLSSSGAPGVIVNRFTNTYDQARNRTQVVESSGDRTSWTYDPSYQLKREYRTGLTSFVVTYGYDPAGNRLTATDSGTRTTSTFDTANQLLTDTTPTGRTTYGYDQCGNRTQKNAPTALTNYKWDEKNRMLAAFPVTNPVTLTYNADGHRVQKATSTTTTNFVFDFEKVLQESNALLTTTNEYTSTTEQYGNLLSAFANNATSYYEPDTLGSTDALVNDLQIATDRWVCRAFGLDNHTQGTTTNSRTFVGRQGYIRDLETDLYFIGARYYDYAAGRWISEDPIGYQDDIHLYRYVRNNPVNGVDPSGKRLLISTGLSTEPQSRRECPGWGTIATHALLEALESAIKYEFRVSGGGIRFDDFMLTFGQNPSGYNAVDFVWNQNRKTGIPSQIWQAIRERSVSIQDPPRHLSMQQLLLLISGWDDDYVLTSPDRTPTENNVGSANYFYRGAQGTTFVFQHGRPDTTNADLGFLDRLLLHIGGPIADFGVAFHTGALRVAGRVARVALTALLQGARLLVPDLDIGAFFNWIDTFVGRIRTIVDGILSHPGRYAQNIINRVGQGFGRFFGNPTSVLQGLSDWVFRAGQNPTAPMVPMNLNPGSLATYLLALVGIDVMRLTQGTQNVAQASEQAQEILDAIGSGNVGELLSAFNASVLASGHTERITPEDIRREAFDLLTRVVIEHLPGVVIGILGRFLGSFVAAIYKFVKWIFDGRLRDIAREVGGIVSRFGDVLEGAADTPAAVAGAVNAALGPALRLFLGLLDLIPGVEEVKGLLRTWRDAISAWLRRLWERLTGWLRGFTYGQSDNPRVRLRLGPAQPRGMPNRLLEISIDHGAWVSWDVAKSRRASLNTATFNTQAREFMQLPALSPNDANASAQAKAGLMRRLDGFANRIVGTRGALPAACPAAFARSTGTTSVMVSWFNQSIDQPNGAVALVTPASTGVSTLRDFSTGPTKPPWWLALTTQYRQTAYSPGEWQRGHLIGNQLGGPGLETWWNMVPLHRRANFPVMERCEAQIRAAADRGECIDVTVTPIYGNRKVVPLSVRIVATSRSSNFRIDVTIQNTATAAHQC
jgi:RHS repeat-associated protein